MKPSHPLSILSILTAATAAACAPSAHDENPDAGATPPVMSPDARPAPRCPTMYRDRDGDGHGVTGRSITSCVAVAGWVTSSDDCDDANAQVPGAEICDGIDNNCASGTKDEVCPEGCKVAIDPGTETAYLFCGAVVGRDAVGATWAKANAYCGAVGFHLARIDDALEDAYVQQVASRLVGEGPHWLGGKQTYRQWTWWDETALGYSNWVGSSQPQAGSGSGDPRSYCMIQVGGPSDGQWGAEDCDQPLGFVCEQDRR